jgi:hypothetical protein
VRTFPSSSRRNVLHKTNRKYTLSKSFSTIFLDGWRDSPGVSVADVFGLVAVPKRSVERWLADAVSRGLLVRTGAGRGTRYGLGGTPTTKSHIQLCATLGQSQAEQVAAPILATGEPLQEMSEIFDILPTAEPLELVHQLADLEEANAALAEAAAMDQAEQEPPTTRRPSRARPNAPAAPRTPGDWVSTNVGTGNGTRTPTRPADVPDGRATVLVALANARRKIHASTLWRDRSTWSALRAAIPPPRR